MAEKVLKVGLREKKILDNPFLFGTVSFIIHAAIYSWGTAILAARGDEMGRNIFAAQASIYLYGASVFGAHSMEVKFDRQLAWEKIVAGGKSIPAKAKQLEANITQALENFGQRPEGVNTGYWPYAEHKDGESGFE